MCVQIVDRCQWKGLYGTCSYHYRNAVETAGYKPGEVLKYHCGATASRTKCSAECQSLFDKATAICTAKDSYNPSSMPGTVISYKGMSA
jgi:hypothetical protein